MEEKSMLDQDKQTKNWLRPGTRDIKNRQRKEGRLSKKQTQTQPCNSKATASHQWVGRFNRTLSQTPTMSQALLIYRGNNQDRCEPCLPLASPHSFLCLASTRQEAFILQSITPTCQLPYFTIVFGDKAFTLWSGKAWNWWYSPDCPRSCSNLKDREKKCCDIFSIKTWMLRKTNNAFLAKISAPNLIHSMELTAYTAGQVTFLFPSWLLYHTWHVHITATESLQKRRRREGEWRGAEGSRGEPRGVE